MIVLIIQYSNPLYPLRNFLVIGAFIDLGVSTSGSLSLLTLSESLLYGGGVTGCLTSSISSELASSSEIGGEGTSKFGVTGGILIGAWSS